MDVGCSGCLRVPAACLAGRVSRSRTQLRTQPRSCLECHRQAPGRAFTGQRRLVHRLQDERSGRHRLRAASPPEPQEQPPPPAQLRERDRGAEGRHAGDVGVRAALAVLWLYKNAVSPLLPKSCRFLPTCSSFSVEAYKEFGFCRGSVLTAWRILRCNPLGKGGFDPPRWPPVGLERLFGQETPG